MKLDHVSWMKLKICAISQFGHLGNYVV
jgi:hypothetical protein